MKYLKNILIFISFLVVINLFLSLFQLLNIINSNILEIFSYILTGIYIFINSFKEGHIATSKGYLVGLKNGLIYIIILLILGIIFYKFKFNISTIIYFSSIILLSIFGSMFGISKKTEK